MGAVRLFLFAGPEIGERNDAVEKLRTAARKESGQLDEYSLYAGETPITDVAGLLTNESLFADARFIVLKNADVIKKKEDIALLASLPAVHTQKNATPVSTLVLISDAVSIDKKLEAVVPKENRKIFWELFENRKEQWLKNFFQKSGFRIETDAIELILELVENNTDALSSECSRFFSCFEQGHLVTAAEVERIIAHNREESPFTLFDALSSSNETPQQRLETALSILQKIKLSKDSSGIQLLAGLTYCFRKLRQWHSLQSGTQRPSDFELKTAGFTSQKARTQYASAARLWTAAQTEAILTEIARTDMDIRTLGQQPQTLLLQMLLYTIVVKNGAEREEIFYGQL